MKHNDFSQYSPSWWAIRKGRPTASEFGRIITTTGKPSKASTDYICELVASLASDDDGPEGFVSPAMQHGSLIEPEARAFYEFERGVTVTEVGFCLSDCGRFGCSPDGLVGADGLMECKGPQGKAHVKYLLEGKMPPVFKAQCHGQLIVTGREWCDLLIYSRGFAPFLCRVTRNAYTEQLAEALEAFWERYAEAVVKVFPGREMRLEGMDVPIRPKEKQS